MKQISVSGMHACIYMNISKRELSCYCSLWKHLHDCTNLLNSYYYMHLD